MAVPTVRVPTAFVPEACAEVPAAVEITPLASTKSIFALSPYFVEVNLIVPPAADSATTPVWSEALLIVVSTSSWVAPLAKENEVPLRAIEPDALAPVVEMSAAVVVVAFRAAVVTETLTAPLWVIELPLSEPVRLIEESFVASVTWELTPLDPSRSFLVPNCVCCEMREIESTIEPSWSWFAWTWLWLSVPEFAEATARVRASLRSVFTSASAPSAVFE